jgi:hypothetical protein
MKAWRFGLALAGGALVLAAPARGQDAVMQTARPLEASAFRVALHPVLLPEGDDELGLAGRAEWALSGRLAFQSRFALYNDLGFLGAQAIYALSRGGELELAAQAGVHRSFPDRRDGFYGADLALLASAELQDEMAVFGSLDLDREWPPAPFDAITRFHLTVGLERAVSERLRALVEVGLGLGDDSPHYVSAGFAWTSR